MSTSPTDEPFLFASSAEADTDALGAALADVLVPGTVVGLVGQLGAGKTRLVQAVAERLEVERRSVGSPTFVLIQEYEGRLPIFHIDTYRLRDADEFLALGVDEILESDGVCFIEWADRVRDVLPADMLWIEAAVTGETAREFSISASGPQSRVILDNLRQLLG